MTLFREINSLLFGLFLLVMSCLAYFQFTQTRDFMAQQMESDLNNTMTSLGLMLKPHLETGDMVTAETLVNVVFEGGLYREVKLTMFEDNSEQVWQNTVVVDGVPDWFIGLNLFSSKRQESVITSGWLQLAKLEIEAHPALAYQGIWRVMNDSVMILSLFFILAVVFFKIRLKRIFHPLEGIVKQAQAISDKQFGAQIAEPETAELKQVVKAMNTMSGQLKQIFYTLDQEVHQLRDEKLVDLVSGLPNRQYLMAQLDSWLTEPGVGGLVLARFDWLEQVHSKYGYQGRDESIASLSKRMTAQLADIAPGIIARISNIEFAFLLTLAEKETMEQYISALIRLVNQEITRAGFIANERFALGVSQRVQGIQAAQLMALSDSALQQAIKSQQVSHWLGNDKQPQLNREQWRIKLTNAIEQKAFALYWQAANELQSGGLIHREVYCRLSVNDEVISASEFIPYVDMLSLGNRLDKCLIKLLSEQDSLKEKPQPIAVNLSLDSIEDDSFASWLSEFLSESEMTNHLSFEISESAIIASFEKAHRFIQMIKSAGAKVGIDQCGRYIGSLDYLQKLTPDYIKLDKSFSFLEQQSQNQELCRAIINVAKGLNINVIITGVEDSEQKSRFAHTNVQGYQGYITPIEAIN